MKTTLKANVEYLTSDATKGLPFSKEQSFFSKMTETTSIIE